MPFAGAGAPGEGGFGGAPGSSGQAGAVATAGGGGSGGIFDPVPAADAEPKSGSRLKAMRYQGADSSEQHAHVWFDSERNEQCTLQKAADGKTRCLPEFTLSTGGFFTNPGCTLPAVLSATSCDELAYVGFYAVTCSAGTRIFQKGQAVPNYYFGSPASCSGPSPPPAGQIVRPLTEVPPSSFVEMALSQAP